MTAAAPEMCPLATSRLAVGLAVAAIALGVAIRLAFPLDSNIDWLTSVARVVADGGVLGRDIVETNPPMAVWIQLPAVLAERLTGLPAEPLQAGLVFAAGVAAALHAARRLAAAGLGGRFDAAILLAVLLVMPLSAFAEREHVALILTLPAIALAAARAAPRTAPHTAPRAADTRPGLAETVVVGLLAGIAAMIKPQFAAATLAVALWLAVRRRSPAALVLPEFVVAGGATLVYLAAVVVFVPDYVRDVLPAVLDVYRPIKHGLGHMLVGVKTLEWLAGVAAILWLERRRAAAAPTGALLAASAGFLAGFLEQGRGWPYHVYPAAALLLVVLLRIVPAALASGDARRRVPAVAGLLAGLMPIANFGYFIYPSRDIVAAIHAAVPHPTLAALATDLTPGHPITTEVGGRWVGTHASRWITAYARARMAATDDPAVKAICERWIAFDRAVANRDLAVKRPDIVLVGLGSHDWPAWIAADPETARLMAGYRLLARQPIDPADGDRFEAVEAWIRADLARAP
jgi:hypothetical protein